MSDSEEIRLRSELADTARVLYERGHNAPRDGNLSTRWRDGFLCTPSGVHKGKLAPGDLVALASDGSPIDQKFKPSSEIRMHLAIYEMRPDIHAIVHAHSPYTVALTLAGHSLAAPTLPEAIVLLRSIPTVPYATPTTLDVPAAIRTVAANHDAFVLERHGPVCLGFDLADAFQRLEVVEHTAKITAIARSLGRVIEMPEDEVARLLALR